MARRPATEKRRLTLTARVPAARERVFRAWTTPEDIVRWWGRPWGATVPSAEVDLRVGGRYRIVMRRTLRGEVSIVGAYQEIDPPARLVYSFAWERGEWRSREMLVTVEFKAKGDQTEIVLTHSGFSNRASGAFHRAGWRSGWKRLRALLAEGRTK